jgi:hypothetical protein
MISSYDAGFMQTLYEMKVSKEKTFAVAQRQCSGIIYPYLMIKGLLWKILLHKRVEKQAPYLFAK